MQQQIAAALTSERLLATLSTAFGLLALLLACIGLYLASSPTTWHGAHATLEFALRSAPNGPLC